MQLFERQLADLLVDHPRVAALRNSATDAAAARLEHLRLLRQMIHDATTYAEGEVFVHLQQLTHQPAMTVNGKTISGSDFILDEVTFWIGRLACIGLQPRLLVGLLGSIRRRVDRTYDDRIAAARLTAIYDRRRPGRGCSGDDPPPAAPAPSKCPMSCRVATLQPGLQDRTLARPAPCPDAPMPYGVAIAAGGVWVLLSNLGS